MQESDNKANQQKQRTFSLTSRQDPTFENFFVGPNGLVVSALQKAMQGQGERFIYLWGEPEVGRSHLLQATCSAFVHKGTVGYWDFNNYTDIGPEVLQGWEKKELVCLDNIERVLGQLSWERKLFYLYNHLLEASNLLIVSANQPPASLQCVLPDLYSRLNAALILCVRPLSDEDKVVFLCNLAKKKGLTLPVAVAEYLVRHENRALPALLARLGRLERATLVHQRKVTVPFVKEVLTSEE